MSWTKATAGSAADVRQHSALWPDEVAKEAKTQGLGEKVQRTQNEQANTAVKMIEALTEGASESATFAVVASGHVSEDGFGNVVLKVEHTEHLDLRPEPIGHGG